MPIYEYTCETCEHDFELLIRGDDVPGCPDCGSSQVARQLSVPAAHTGSSSFRDLPVCQPPAAGGCGLPQCQTGGCQME